MNRMQFSVSDLDVVALLLAPPKQREGGRSAWAARSLSVALLALFASQAFSQTAGNSDPSGFITLSVPGTKGVGSNRLTYLGLGLTRPVEYQRTASAIGPNTITDNGASWTIDQ